MSGIDKAVANAAYIEQCMPYIGQCLMALKEIWEVGDCNDCGNKGCGYEPLPGQMVRYNCPHYKKKEVQKPDADQIKPGDEVIDDFGERLIVTASEYVYRGDGKKVKKLRFWNRDFIVDAVLCKKTGRHFDQIDALIDELKK